MILPVTAGLLAVLLTLGGLQAAPQENGIIEGAVIRFGAGDPLASVEIVLNVDGRPLSDGLTAAAVTDSSGHFVIDDVSPGTYTLNARKPGYANPAPNGISLRNGGATWKVTVAPGQHVRADFALVPGAAIRGRLIDPSGKPAANRMLRALSMDDVEVQATRTDDRGEYHLVGLSPGRYYLRADADLDHIQTYFPGAADRTKAGVVEVAEGAVVNGTDLSIQTQVPRTISGRLVSADGGPIQGVVVGVRLRSRGTNGSLEPTRFISSGRFEPLRFSVDGVAPGSYDLYLVVDVPSRPLKVVGHITINVGNEDLKDVTVVAGAFEVKGQFVVANGAAKPVGAVRLRLMPEDVEFGKSNVDASGTFSITHVFSATWKVEVSDLPADLAVLDIRQGRVSVYDGGLTVEEKPPEPIEVILGAAGSIEGVVRDAQQMPVAAAQLILIPNTTDPAHPALFRKAIADGAGRFAMANVSVGLYTMFALDSAVPIPESVEGIRALLIPSYQTLGAAVSVRPGVKTNVSIATAPK